MKGPENRSRHPWRRMSPAVTTPVLAVSWCVKLARMNRRLLGFSAPLSGPAVERVEGHLEQIAEVAGRS